MVASVWIRTILAAPVPPRETGPVPMEPAPKIVCERILNAPAGVDTSWEALRGKVVVVVFWETVCAPCVASIPSMNKLEASLENDPIVFVHITDEEEPLIRAFLKKTPIRGWVGIDANGKTFKNYGVNGLPSLAFVGKNGKFLGWSDPRLLVADPGIIKDVLATGSSKKLGRTQGSPDDPLRGVNRSLVSGQGGHNLCDIVIRRSDGSSTQRQGGGDGRGSWSFDRPLRSHIANFCGVSSSRIIAEPALPEEHYDIIALGRNGATPEAKEAVCRLIGATFDLSLQREKREMDVFLLRTLAEREPTLTPSWGGVYNDVEARLTAPSAEILERMKNGENHFFALCPLPWLGGSISRAVNKPVVSELGTLPEENDGVYSFCFPYPRGDVEAFRREFEKHVGLSLVPAKREVEVLIVKPTPE